MQSAAFAINRAKNSGKATFKGKGKWGTTHSGNSTAKGSYNDNIFASKGKGNGMHERCIIGNISDVNGQNRCDIFSSKGKGKAKGKVRREVRAHEDVNAVKGQGRRDFLPSKGKGKAKETDRCDVLTNSRVKPAKGKGKGGAKGKGKGKGRREFHGKGDANNLGIEGKASMFFSNGTDTCRGTGKVAENGTSNRRRNKRNRRHPNSHSPEVCAICQEDMDGTRTHLDCMHSFHTACALRGLASIRRSGCPLCRKPAPVWLSGVSAQDSIDVRNLPSDSDDDDDDTTWWWGIPPNSSDSEDEPPRTSVSLVSDDFYDYYDDQQRGIEELRDEFPDLDSDALENLYDERMQDFDETGSYYSHGS